jgi:mono/diheme cytochrome c family protein
MTSRAALAGVAAAILAVPALLSAAAGEDVNGRIDYVQHCAGCHGFDGTGVKSAGVPAFANVVGNFLRLPQGRAFLVQVPGVNNAGLDDERIARLTNWVLRSFAGRSLPADFVSYDAAEVATSRASRPADIAKARAALGARLSAMGYSVD